MGNLTKDMTRLCQEIGDWRRERGDLGQKLVRATKTRKVMVQHLRTENKKAQTHLAKVARADRLSFVNDLKSRVFYLRQGHRQALEQMGAENGTRLRAFVADLQGQVANLQATFRRSQAEMARKGRTVRRQFLSRLERTVSHLRQETAADLSGCRRAFFGPSLAEQTTKVKVAAERLHQEKQEAQRRAASLAEAEHRDKEAKKPVKGK
jgi:hypothetical protein